MAAKGGRIDFMFLSLPPYPAAGSATGVSTTEAAFIFEQDDHL